MYTDQDLRQIAIDIASGKIMKNEYVFIAQEITQIRRDIHKGQNSQKILSTTSELKGILGEFEFSQRTKLIGDFTRKKFGDKYDFELSDKTKIDIKTRDKKYDHTILVPGRSINPDYIYVLESHHYRTNQIEIKKWAYGNEILKGTYGDPHHSGIDSYGLHISQMREMNELYKKIGCTLDKPNIILTF
jgi:hypothetical protein